MLGLWNLPVIQDCMYNHLHNHYLFYYSYFNSTINMYNKLCIIIIIGQYVGSVISFPLTALLCVYGFDGGWPSVFYCFGR